MQEVSQVSQYSTQPNTLIHKFLLKNRTLEKLMHFRTLIPKLLLPTTSKKLVSEQLTALPTTPSSPPMIQVAAGQYIYS
jgi:hypothetical protein